MHFTPEQRDAWRADTKNSPFNVWLRNRVNRRDGTLDLARLHSLAEEYGIDCARYIHLNPGQQRMSIGNRLRSLVPQDVYQTDAARPVLPAAPNIPALMEVESKRSMFQIVRQALGIGSLPNARAEAATLAGVSTRELLGRYSAILDELRNRKVIRTGNAPLGDYAEHLFAEAFGWTLTGNSAAGHDATDQAGAKYQIKARRLRTGGLGERQLGILRRLPDGNFDFLAAVLFASDFTVSRAALIPHALVLARAAHVTHVNGWRFILDNAVWSLPGVRDVSDKLIKTARGL